MIMNQALGHPDYKKQFFIYLHDFIEQHQGLSCFTAKSLEAMAGSLAICKKPVFDRAKDDELISLLYQTTMSLKPIDSKTYIRAKDKLHALQVDQKNRRYQFG